MNSMINGFTLIIYIQLFHINHCYGETYLSLYSEGPGKVGTGQMVHADLSGLNFPEGGRYKRSLDAEDTFVDNNNNKSQKKPKFSDHDSVMEPDIKYVELNNSHHLVMVDWAGEGSEVLVCVTKDVDQNQNSTTNVYISYDYGTTFLDKSNRLKINENENGIIYKFYKNENFIDRFVFSDIINKYLFVTHDFGHTIYPRKLDFTPSEVSMHPTDSLTFLIMDRKEKSKKLWITTDFGEAWKLVSLYVKSYYWSEKATPPVLYVEREEPGSKNTVLAFESLKFDGEFTSRVVMEDVKEFKVKDDFLFAVKKKHGAVPSQKEELGLWISYRNGPFLLASFPAHLLRLHYHYYVADISDGQIMLVVLNGDNSNSELYVSSVPTSPSDNIRFSLSLSRILFFNPGTNYNNTWLSLKAHEPFADLHRVQGMRGVFIASQLVASYSSTSHGLSPEHLTSLITFDQGGEWKPITPPKYDMEGKHLNCKLENGCSLHISQELSKLYPGTQSKPILTTKSAPGMILSSGTVGQSLKGHTQVFLSTDAGVNWYQMLKGNYLYMFGDHGGIMMAVQHYRSDGQTDEFLYSIDEGETWHSHKFFPEKIRVYGLMTEPGENSTIFTLFGSKLEKHEWIIVKIDMLHLFKYKCSAEDYKSWTPLDASSGRLCLLGRRDVYERRIPHSNCFNGLDYDQPVSSLNCPCTRQDYECDFAYHLTTSTNKCDGGDTQDLVSLTTVPMSCTKGEFYNRTKGYRKVPGDTCVGGEDYKFEAELTPCPLQEEREFLLVSNRNSVLRYDMLNPQEGLKKLPLQNLEAVIALDFHLKNNCLYWSDAITKKIMRQCFDGNHRQETLVESGIESAEGLALDWVSHLLYMVDGVNMKVEVMRIDAPFNSRMRKTIIQKPDVGLPRGIALHPVRGYLFLTDWSEANPKVARAHLDGTNLQILFGKGQVGWPNGITIDFQTERIFWADAKFDYIASSDLDGKGFRKVISDSENVRQPFAVGIYKSLLYWDDWNSFKIFRADKENGWNVTPLSDDPIIGLVDLKVFGHWSQTGSNACGEGSDPKCEFFCTGTPNNDYTCLCPEWLERVEDGEHHKCVCKDGSSPNLMGACKTSQNTTGTNSFKCKNGYFVPVTMLCDMDNDCGDFSDEENCSLNNSCDGGSLQCKNGHCISPAWKCDSDNDCGDNSDEEGCEYKACREDQFTCKNKRCIDKKWVCDLQDDCRDGSDEANCTKLIPEYGLCRSTQFMCNSSHTCLPISWRCDNEVDCSDKSDETDCETHKCNQFQFQCSSNKCIYLSWLCDGDTDCQDGLDEEDCDSSTGTTTSTVSPFSPPAKNATCSSFEFRCVNGNCVPFWWRCDLAFDCLDGSDEMDCGDPRSDGGRQPGPINVTTIAPTSFSCRQDQMECSNGECIWEAWICDGDQDCSGGEDEQNCHQKTFCQSDEYRCWHTEGCIAAALRCNGHRDCSDGSDEMGCNSPSSNSSSPPSPLPTCALGHFSCDGGNCLPDRKRCDSNNDCIDFSDEANCQGEDSKVYQVRDLRKKLATNTSLSFDWKFDSKLNGTTFQFMPSCIVKAALGNAPAWNNGTWTDQLNYTFERLIPYTTYLLKVYVREKETNKVFLPSDNIIMTTTVGVPSPPVDIQVSQVGEHILIEWDLPHHPNGPIDVYTVYVSPPNPAKLFKVNEGLHKQYIIPSQPDQNLTVWMTCTNGKYTSLASQSVEFTPSSIDHAVNGFSVKSKDISEVILVWEPILGVDGYIVSYTYPENRYVGSQFSKNVSTPEIHLKNLSPGLKYIFKVRGFKASVIGPFSTLEVELPGDRLPGLFDVKSRLLSDSGTSVLVSWEAPPYKSKYIWKYEILYGKTISDLRQRIHVLNTTNTSIVISELDACEVYIIAAMIAGPIGVGPTSGFQVLTKEDRLSPPKFLAVKSEGKMMRITWSFPCPRSPDLDLRYFLTITETSFNKSSFFDIPSLPENKTQGYRVQMHYGGKYRISVRTNLNGSRSASPVFIDGPKITAPYELTYNPSDSSFFWRNSKNIPSELLSSSHSYVLYMSRTSTNDTETPEVAVEVKEPPYQAFEMDPGQVYYAYVAFKDKDGYMSKVSQSIRVEKPIGDALVVAQRSVVGVAVSVIVVIIVLVALIGMLVVRHKRLARSFSAFANSHYDPSQGTTHITTDHNLDEDDSPMIHGFSDDEPLVIA